MTEKFFKIFSKKLQKITRKMFFARLFLSEFISSLIDFFAVLVLYYQVFGVCYLCDLAEWQI